MGCKQNVNAYGGIYNTKWKGLGATYTITYNANGGIGAPTAQVKTEGVNLTLSTVQPTRTGYTFQGWSSSPTSTLILYSPGGSYIY